MTQITGKFQSQVNIIVSNPLVSALKTATLFAMKMSKIV